MMQLQLDLTRNRPAKLDGDVCAHQGIFAGLLSTRGIKCGADDRRDLRVFLTAFYLDEIGNCALPERGFRHVFAIELRRDTFVLVRSRLAKLSSGSDHLRLILTGIIWSREAPNMTS
jgi:hypothetical protein